MGRQHARRAASAPPPASSDARVQAGAENASAQEALPRSNALATRSGMLAHALGAVGGQELDRGQAARLAALQGRLGVAQQLLDQGDVDAAAELIDALDADAGDLVASSGTVIDLAATTEGDGTFDDVRSLYVNGMNQSLTKSMSAAQMLADVRGTDVGLVYNDTDGFLPDLGQAVGQKLQHLVPFYEHRTDEGGTLANAVQDGMRDGGQVNVVTHSQGANFAKEAVQRLDDTRSGRDQLDRQLQLTMMGAPLDRDELPDHFDNVTFLEEKDDPVSNHLGRRDRDEQRSWWERIPIFGRDRAAGDERVVEFDDPDAVWHDGAHDPATYLSHPDAIRELRRDPF